MSTYTAGEIVTAFRQAKRKRAQIDILAQLNDIKPSDVRKILVEAGIDVEEACTVKQSERPNWEPIDPDIMAGMEPGDVADKHGLPLDKVRNRRTYLRKQGLMGPNREPEPPKVQQPVDQGGAFVIEPAVLPAQPPNTAGRMIDEAIGLYEKLVSQELSMSAREAFLTGQIYGLLLAAQADLDRETHMAQ